MGKRIEIEDWGNGYIVREFVDECKKCHEKHWRMTRETKYQDNLDRRINPLNYILNHIKEWLRVK